MTDKDKIVARVALTADDYYNIDWALDILSTVLKEKYGATDADLVQKHIKSFDETRKRLNRGLKS